MDETELRRAKEKIKVANAEVGRLRAEGEAIEAKCNNAERLRKELEELRTGFTTQKKEL